MAFFSRFDGDDNEELFLLQRSTWYEENKSTIIQFFKPSIDRYRYCASLLDRYDPIRCFVNSWGITYEYFYFRPIVEIASAFYRFIYGYQYRIPFPSFDVPQTRDEWVSHFREFISEEGKYFSEDYEFFPDIIHLLVIQNLPYAIELQKHLLLITSKVYSARIWRLFEREIQFISPKEMKELEGHEKNFEKLNRNEIIKLIETQEQDNSENIGPE